MTTEYPEHEKLRAVREKSQAIGEFLDWLGEEKGLSLVVQHEHDGNCRGEDGRNGCGYRKGDYAPSFASTRALLAEFFEIDEERLEREKRAMLAELRGEKAHETERAP
jgi:hypothetical protein